MIIDKKTIIREIDAQDKTQLANLIHFGTYVHRHLDWRPSLDWIGHKPFLGIESEGRLLAALSCASDPPGISWIRLFVTSAHLSQTLVWNQLWPLTREALLKDKVEVLAAIPLQKWIRLLLLENKFNNSHNIISFAWDNNSIVNHPRPKNTEIRLMKKTDLKEVAHLDRTSFHPLWRNSASLLELAFNQSVYSTVSTDGEQITGYQITTPTQYGVHLGRLAVAPNYQGQGIGYALVHDLQSTFAATEDYRISVNTQDNNQSSIALYTKAGFHQTTEIFPVFQYNF